MVSCVICLQIMCDPFLSFSIQASIERIFVISVTPKLVTVDLAFACLNNQSEQCYLIVHTVIIIPNCGEKNRPIERQICCMSYINK